MIRCGRALAAAKDEMPHGAFTAMVEKDLPFGTSTARRLMAIGADPRIADMETKRAHGLVLPASWRTLYDLTTLDDATFMRLRNPHANVHF